MARIISTEVRKRGFFGTLFKWLFITFNILMAVWLFAYWGQIGGMMAKETSRAAQAGGIIGAGMGTGVLLVFWAAGVAVLGGLSLATRGKKIIIQETME